VSLRRQYVKFDESKEALPRYLRSQIDLVGGFVMIITGGNKHKMGTGKSWTAIRIGELVDPLFSIKKVCSTHTEFLRELGEISKSKKPYQVIIMDEAAVAVSNKQWQSESNKLIGFSMDIMRDTRSIAIFITPGFFMIDKTLRTLPAYWGYCVKVRDTGHKIKVLFYLNELITDQITGKVYYGKLRFHDNKTNRVMIAKAFQVTPPSKDLSGQYTDKSTLFKEGMRERFYSQALSTEKLEGLNLNERFDFGKTAKEIYDHPSIKKMLEKKGRISDAAVRLVQPDMAIYRAQTLARLVNLYHEAGGYDRAEQPPAATG
jgi:hypothetical protein